MKDINIKASTRTSQ